MHLIPSNHNKVKFLSTRLVQIVYKIQIVIFANATSKISAKRKVRLLNVKVEYSFTLTVPGMLADILPNPVVRVRKRIKHIRNLR